MNSYVQGVFGTDLWGSEEAEVITSKGILTEEKENKKQTRFLT